ncbi:MAG: DUF2029 domain-containing protein [Clostridiales bacterium]|nr:DUF2029 domain-containing protein [Clostridiales bacterium]
MEKNTSSLEKKNKMPTVKQFVIFFTVFFACNLFIILVLGAASGGSAWTSMLFHNGSTTDTFMDFLNSIRDASSDDVYTERNVIYPPLSNLIFRLLSKLISPDLAATQFSQRKLLLLDRVSMMIYFLFAVVCILSMLRIIESYANIKSKGKMKIYASIISFLMIISYPVVYCLERGNITILCIVLATFFLLFKDSESKVVRELSYIALALSAGIKLYPALFGLTLIIEKKYKEAARLVGYGVIAVVVPMLFFVDFSAEEASVSAQIFTTLKLNLSVLSSDAEESSSVVVNLIQNLLSFATKKSSFNLSCVSIQNIVFLIFGSDTTLATMMIGVTEIIALIMAFFAKKEWQKLFFLCYIILNIPSASSSYALGFLMAPMVVLLFNSGSFRKRDWVYIVCFALLFAPLPTLWYYHPEVVTSIFEKIGYSYNSRLNQCIATYVFQFMFVFLTVDALTYSPKKKSKKKMAALSGASEGAVGTDALAADDVNAAAQENDDTAPGAETDVNPNVESGKDNEA